MRAAEKKEDGSEQLAKLSACCNTSARHNSINFVVSGCNFFLADVFEFYYDR